MFGIQSWRENVKLQRSLDFDQFYHKPTSYAPKKYGYSVVTTTEAAPAEVKEAPVVEVEAEEAPAPAPVEEAAPKTEEAPAPSYDAPAATEAAPAEEARYRYY